MFMPQTTITITINTPNNITIAQLVSTLADYWHYPGTVLPDGRTNPQTASQFIQQRIADYLRDSYILASASQAAETAKQSAIATAGTVTAS
jgi:hypothetical protein